MRKAWIPGTLLLAAPLATAGPAAAIRYTVGSATVEVLETTGSGGATSTSTGADYNGQGVYVILRQASVGCSGDDHDSGVIVDAPLSGAEAVLYQECHEGGGCDPRGSETGSWSGTCAIVACAGHSVEDRSDSPDLPTATGETDASPTLVTIAVIVSSGVSLDRTAREGALDGRVIATGQRIDYEVTTQPSGSCTLAGGVEVEETHYGVVDGGNRACL